MVFAKTAAKLRILRLDLQCLPKTIVHGASGIEIDGSADEDRKKADHAPIQQTCRTFRGACSMIGLGMHQLRLTLPSLPSNMRDLPVDTRGYPIPFFVQGIDGAPEFRLANREIYIAASY
jgi:hypothetical protein